MEASLDPQQGKGGKKDEGVRYIPVSIRLPHRLQKLPRKWWAGVLSVTWDHQSWWERERARCTSEVSGSDLQVAGKGHYRTLTSGEASSHVTKQAGICNDDDVYRIRIDPLYNTYVYTVFCINIDTYRSDTNNNQVIQTNTQCLVNKYEQVTPPAIVRQGNYHYFNINQTIIFVCVCVCARAVSVEGEKPLKYIIWGLSDGVVGR